MMIASITRISPTPAPIEEHERLLQFVAHLQTEVARLREDNLQLRCALSLYSEAARQSLD